MTSPNRAKAEEIVRPMAANLVVTAGIVLGQTDKEILVNGLEQALDQRDLEAKREHHCKGCSGIDKPGAFDV